MIIVKYKTLQGEYAGSSSYKYSCLPEAVDPVTEHHRGIEQEREDREHRKREREMLGDLLKEGAANAADIDRLNRLDAEEREERRP